MLTAILCGFVVLLVVQLLSLVAILQACFYLKNILDTFVKIEGDAPSCEYQFQLPGEKPEQTAS